MSPVTTVNSLAEDIEVRKQPEEGEVWECIQKSSSSGGIEHEYDVYGRNYMFHIIMKTLA